MEEIEEITVPVTEYITHHDFDDLALCGEKLSLPRGTVVYCLGNVLVTPDGKLICLATSENGKRHFTRNDDKKGLERGDITHAIAFEQFPFTADNVDMLRDEYADWLQPHDDTILFNDNFFSADLEDLTILVDRLNA